jgi:CRISPR-associated protein Cas2
MTQRYSHLSGYRLMWIWTLFDLPVVMEAERKRASRFRADLLDLGFEMVQFSVYARHAASKEKAEALADQVGRLIPEGGKVSVLFFTDRQFGAIRNYRCQKPVIVEKKPSQLVLF